MKHYGLRLTVGGAPNTPHIIPGVPGFYRPDSPTAVDGPGEVSLDAAKGFAADPSTHLELVEIDAKDVETCRQQAADDIADSRNAQRQARRSAKTAPERDRVKDEQAATAKE